jgi:hypothetical protein
LDRHVLLAAQDEAHRTSGGACQERGVRAGRGGRVFLAAEAAAGHRLHDARVAQVAAERGGHRLLHVERALHGAVDDDARAFRHRDHAVGLDVGVLLVGRVVRAFDHDHIRPAQGDARFPAPHLPLRQELAGGEGLLHIEERGERLVFHDDRLQGGGQGLAILRRHQGHRFPDVPHLARGQHRPVVLDHRDEVAAGDVGGGEDGVHARHRARRGHVQPLDLRVGVRGAQHTAAQSARHREVLDVESGALDLVESVGPADALADDHRRCRSLMGIQSMNDASRTFKFR